jgi:pimeloyl-ACP methyl ester carboxylesterase
MTGTRGIASTLGVMAVALAVEAFAGAVEDVGHGFAPVNGTRLFYEVRGMGPALVLIHGGQLDCRMWGDQFTAFSQHFRVIRYDVRGYGGSSRPDKPYSDAADLAALLDYHCWLENPILQRPPRPAAASRLGEIKVPTLLVIGDRDVPQIKATVETLERGIGGAKKVSIKGAGHMANMENPVTFNAAVLEFLRGQGQRPTAPPPPSGDRAQAASPAELSGAVQPERLRAFA